jgi:prophage regulatory protein
MPHPSRPTSERHNAARAGADAPRLFARLPTVMQATGLGRSTIYRLMAEGTFPMPVHLGPRAVGWRWSDLDRWSESLRCDAT